MKLKTGARALRNIVGMVTFDLQYNAPDLKLDGPRTVVINADFVQSQLERFREALLKAVPGANGNSAEISNNTPKAGPHIAEVQTPAAVATGPEIQRG